MNHPSAPLLVADIFDRFRIALPDGIVNWLTPVWILCVGATVGLILCAAIWGLLWILSRIPVLGTLADNPTPRRAAIVVITIVLFLAALVWMPGLRGAAPAIAPPVAAEQADAAAPAPTANLLDSLWALGGTLLGCWLLAMAAVTLVSRKALAETDIALREGVLFPLAIIAVVMSVLTLVGLVVVRRPTELLDSLARYPTLAMHGTVVEKHTIAAPPNAFDEPPEVPIPVSFRKDEIRQLRIAADQHVKVTTAALEIASPTMFTFDVAAGESKDWRKQPAGVNPFRDQRVTQLYARNYSDAPAEIEVTTVSQMAYPEMLLVPVMAFGMAVIFFTYLFQRAAMPKLAAVSLATAKSDIAQPLYALVLAGGLFLLIVFVYIPYNTFGDDIKQLKDSGLNLILVLCIMQAVWAASTSVSEEVEGKTALTVLSKPVSRRDFILGKFVGISWSTGLLLVVLGLLLLVTVAYKPIYDFREGSWKSPDDINADPTWQNCFAEMVQTTPGLVLVYMEALVMAALSVAISTRLPTLANFIISFAIYVLGHLTPLIVQSQVVANQLPPVVFFGRLIATVLPVLDHFNIQASIAAGAEVPYAYLAWALVYCVLYSSVALLLALTLFEDRDLA